MVTEDRHYSDLPIPPGEYLSEVLDSKGLTQADLARRIGRPLQAVNEIVKGTKAITADTALQLEKALNVPASLWTGLEAHFQITKARLAEEKRIEIEAALLLAVPYKQLAEWHCVAKTRDDKNKVRELHRFYGVASLNNVERLKSYAAAFRVGKTREASPLALEAWIRCGELRAGASESGGPFDRRKLRGSLNAIRGLSTKSAREFEPELKRVLAGCGVSLVMLPHFPKTYAQGATFWMKPNRPVLLMSYRGRWADVFWFSLFHEIGHILLHGKKTFIDDQGLGGGASRYEKEANEFAAEALLPARQFRIFIRQADFSRAAIERFAGQIGLSRGIVIGRLQHDGRISQASQLNRLRDKYVPTESRADRTTR
jgi:HTH-type transcriptional regulator/antitoxin HigA